MSALRPEQPFTHSAASVALGSPGTFAALVMSGRFGNNGIRCVLSELVRCGRSRLLPAQLLLTQKAVTVAASVSRHCSAFTVSGHSNTQIKPKLSRPFAAHVANLQGAEIAAVDCCDKNVHLLA